MSGLTMPIVFDGHNDSLHHLAPFAPADVRRFVEGIPDGAIDLAKARRLRLGLRWEDDAGRLHAAAGPLNLIATPRERGYAGSGASHGGGACRDAAGAGLR